jgi:hypothetical protein
MTSLLLGAISLALSFTFPTASLPLSFTSTAFWAAFYAASLVLSAPSLEESAIRCLAFSYASSARTLPSSKEDSLLDLADS